MGRVPLRRVAVPAFFCLALTAAALAVPVTGASAFEGNYAATFGLGAFPLTSEYRWLSPPTTPPTVYPGLNHQAVPAVVLAVPNDSGKAYSKDDTLRFFLATDPAGENPLSDTATGTDRTGAFSAPPQAFVMSYPPFRLIGYRSVTMSKSAHSPGNDGFSYTQQTDAPADAGTTKFSFGKFYLDLGAGVPPGSPIYLVAKAYTKDVAQPIFGGENAAPGGLSASVKVATIARSRVVANSVGVALGSQSATVGPIAITDYVGSQISGALRFSIGEKRGVWVDAGSLQCPPGVAVAGVSGMGTDTLTFALSGPSPKGSTFILTGASANLDSATGGPRSVSASSATGSLGVSQRLAFVGTLSRIAGSDRYATAALEFVQAFPRSDVAVLASGVGFADALSANYLAAMRGTGVLLAEPHSLPTSTKDAIEHTGVSTVYIVGGTSAVDESVQSEIAALPIGGNLSNGTIQVIRLAGADRYETNLAVDTSVAPSSATAFVATGVSFADALSVGPAVAAMKSPLILVQGGSLGLAAKATITQLGISDVEIVGGTSAVYSAANVDLRGLGVVSVGRLAGDDRTETAAQVALWELSNALGFTTSTVAVARGDAFPDALAAGAVLGMQREPLLLTSSSTVAGPGAPEFFSTQPQGSVSGILGLGGASAINDTTLSAVLGSAP